MSANYSWQRTVCTFDTQGSCQSPQVVGSQSPQAAYLTDASLNLTYTETIGPSDYLVGTNIIEVKLRRVAGLTGSPPFDAPPVVVYRRIIEKNSSGDHTVYLYTTYFEGESPSTTLDSDPANQPNPRALSSSLTGVIQIAVDQFFPDVGTELNHPGTYQWEETHTHNGNLISSRTLETFQMRSIGIRNFKASKIILNPESNEPSITFSGDLVTYPHVDTQGVGNWTPPSDMTVSLKLFGAQWIAADEIEIDITNITPTTAGNDGVVGSFQYVWDGKTNQGTVKECLVGVEVQAIAPIQGGGNTISLRRFGSVEVTRCKCPKRCLTGSTNLSCPISIHKSPVGAPVGANLGYDSGQCGAAPTSPGYGWTSVETVRIYDSGSGKIQLRDSQGHFLSWTETSPGTWSPNYEDNRMTLEVFPSTPEEKYVVTSRAQSKMFFNDQFDYVKYQDSNGNTTTYTRGNNGTNDFFMTSDGLGREVYHHKTAAHNQPTVINDNVDPALGRRYLLAYNGDERLESITDPEGEVQEFYYDGDGRIIELRDIRPTEGNRSVFYSYYPEGPYYGRLRAVDMYGNYQQFYYYDVSFNGEVAVEVDTYDLLDPEIPQGATEPIPNRIMLTSFDTLGRKVADYELLEYGSPSEFLETRYSYTDPNDPYLVTRVVAPNGAATDYTYTARGNLKTVLDAQSNETVMTYVEEDSNHPAFATFPDLLLQVRRPAPDLDNAPTTFYPPTKFEYEPSTANLMSVEDASENKVFMEYNSRGQLTKITDRRWDGTPAAKNDHTTEMVYYANGNLEYIETPEDVGLNPAKRVTFTYDGYDNVTKVVDGLGHQVLTTYDGLDRVLTVTAPHLSTNLNPDITTYTYTDHLLKNVESPANNGSGGTKRNTSMSYDSSGRLQSVNREVASTVFQTRVFYQLDGFSQLRSLLRLHDGNPRQDDFVYDRQGRLIRAIDTLGESTVIAHEPYCVGNAVLTARGIGRRTFKDSLCRTTEIVSADLDPQFPLVLTNAPREQRLFGYDDLGRLRTWNQNIPDIAGYSYSVLGIDKYIEGDIRSFSYDELDRLVEQIFEDTYYISYEWDEESNLTKVADVFGNVTEFVYFLDNTLRQMILKRPSQPDRIFEYRYDAAGRALSITYPSEADLVCKFDDGTNTPGSGWDEKGQLLHMRYEKVSDQSLVRRFEYGYDPSGNREFLLDVAPDSAVRWEYGFDWLDRLVSVKRAQAADVVGLPSSPLSATYLERAYEFNESDNRKYFDDHANGKTYFYTYRSVTDGSTTYFSDQIQEIHQAPTAGERAPGNFAPYESFEYDLDGNLIFRALVGGNETEYEWSDWDRLLYLQSGPFGFVRERLQDNRYDVNGLRKRKLDKNGNSSLEYDVGISTSASRPGAANSQIPTYSYIQGPGGLLGYEQDFSNFNYFVRDHLGSVRAVVNGSGTVIKEFEHDEYGNLISSSGTASVSPKTWIGGLSVNDDTADSGMFLMGHRHYEAGVLGRFISRDPIGFNSSSLNLYAYPANPVSFVDPIGLKPCTVFGAGPESPTIGLRGIVKSFEQGKFETIYQPEMTHTQYGKYLASPDTLLLYTTSHAYPGGVGPKFFGGAFNWRDLKKDDINAKIVIIDGCNQRHDIEKRIKPLLDDDQAFGIWDTTIPKATQAQFRSKFTSELIKGHSLRRARMNVIDSFSLSGDNQMARYIREHFSIVGNQNLSIGPNGVIKR